MKKTMNARVEVLTKKVYAYYRAHGRHAMQWRRARTPYRIVISEVMLQQTQVSRVEKKYPEFIKRFPTFQSLADARTTDVLKVWQGMGYNRRALNLKRAAEIVATTYKGKLPHSPSILETLPGIGKATAGSIAAFAFNRPVPFIETNIRRVFIHFLFSRKKKVSDEEIMKYVVGTIDTKNPREWYYALMDYGAMLATQKKENPNRKSNTYRTQSRFSGSRRELRGKILSLLLAQKTVLKKEIQHAVKRSKEEVESILSVLEKEGFVTHQGAKYTVKEK
ncbi:MAG: A/G-specific adenine glycosylase [Candidatus Paceibacterota bacterium]|jgi:A/G-specific adenine glycosylase